MTYGSIAANDEFRGREEEIDKLLDAARLGESSVVYGPPGIGKTSLITETSRRNREEFVFVQANLTGITDEISLFGVLAREAMRAGYGTVDDFTSEAWALATNPRLRRAILDGGLTGISVHDAGTTSSRKKDGSDETNIEPDLKEIRSCPICSRPMKWIAKYSKYYCYTCKKYPSMRKVKLPIDQAALTPSELQCPKCHSEMRFDHRYSEFFCPECMRYPLLEPTRRIVPKPTMMDMMEALDLPEKIALEKGKRVVVMLDEFQELAALENPMTLYLMRRRFAMHGNVSYIFAGSDRYVLNKLFQEKHSPFHKFAHWIDLGPLSAKELRELLISQFKEAKGKLDVDMAKKIVDLSGGSPHYAKMITHELLHVSSNPTDEDLQEALMMAVNHHSHAYSATWTTIRSPLHRRYLLAAANEPRVPKGLDFVRRHNLKSRSHVQRIEKQLEQKGLIDRGEIVDPIFLIWLRSFRSSAGYGT